MGAPMISSTPPAEPVEGLWGGSACGAGGVVVRPSGRAAAGADSKGAPTGEDAGPPPPSPMPSSPRPPSSLGARVSGLTAGLPLDSTAVAVAAAAPMDTPGGRTAGRLDSGSTCMAAAPRPVFDHVEGGTDIAAGSGDRRGLAMPKSTPVAASGAVPPLSRLASGRPASSTDSPGSAAARELSGAGDKDDPKYLAAATGST